MWRGHGLLQQAAAPGWTSTQSGKRRGLTCFRTMSKAVPAIQWVRARCTFTPAARTHDRIHGTNQPGWIGHAISSGCIRLTNEDVIHFTAEWRWGGCGGTGTEAGSLSYPNGQRPIEQFVDVIWTWLSRFGLRHTRAGKFNRAYVGLGVSKCHRFQTISGLPALSYMIGGKIGRSVKCQSAYAAAQANKTVDSITSSARASVGVARLMPLQFCSQ